MTFKDMFPGLSRTLSFKFQDFLDPGIFKKKSRTLQEVWEPWQLQQLQVKATLL